ncbi:MAG: aminoglycoside phosphotransferase family protein [Candidatus Doudnabacteria bacterium]|nr:aminoglycoside phosphotransferase family protein [Candidatus Doudnabacteria bacterium]
MNKQTLLQQIRQTFPDLQWKTAKHNIEGWDHYVLILDDKYVFRFPRGKEYFPVLKNEVLLLQHLRNKVKLQLPEYLWIAKDGRMAGYRLIEGDQLKPDLLQKLPAKTKTTIARQIAEFLTVLHSMPLLEAKKYAKPEKSSQDLYTDMVKKVRKILFPKIAKKYQGIIENFFLEFKNYLHSPHKTLIHNDFYHDHILLDHNKKSLAGIIDFADRVIDDPARDFTELWIYGEDFVKEVYRNYSGPKDKHFLKRAAMYNKRMALWNMLSSFEGHRGNFRKSYTTFKEIFLGK